MTSTSSSYKLAQKLSEGLDAVDLSRIESSILAIDQIENKKEQKEQLKNICRDNGILHPDWLHLAGRVGMDSLKDDCPPLFSESVLKLSPILDDKYATFVRKNAEKLDRMVVESRDWRFSIFGLETLVKSYLARIKLGDERFILETPQYLYMRVATYLWYPNLEKIEQVYNDLSQGVYTHASPTMFNSGLKRPQCASCFLTTIPDNMDGISKAWKDIATMSKHSGGWGIDVTQLRHSEIGQYGDSKGLTGWIQIIDKILSIVDQGGKRKGSGTFWCTCFHLDFAEFVELKLVTGSDAMRARESFYGVVIHDLFMERVEKDEEWTLFCPNKAKGLADTYGIEFEMLYLRYEREVEEGKMKTFRKVRARDIWKKIINAQIETGGPFILYKDSANRKSNQQNIGIIRQSNLCCEILLATGKVKRPEGMKMEIQIPTDLLQICENNGVSDKALLEIANYLENDRTKKDEYESIASCNLASVALNKYVVNMSGDIPPEDRYNNYDFAGLERDVGQIVENLNQVIDRNFYPKIVPEIRECNLANRSLGIGVQGLADTFALLDLEWESNEATMFNKLIFETIYYAAVKKSVELAKEQGPYVNFKGSPASKGFFQFDLWDYEEYQKEYSQKLRRSSPEITTEWLNNHLPDFSKSEEVRSNRYDWQALRTEMMEHGLRNSTLLAVMPTASSANILGNNECIEPYTQNLYARTVLSGQFVMINKHLVKDLAEIGMWNTATVRGLVSSGGSLQSIECRSDDPNAGRFAFLKKKYKTVFEISHKKCLVPMMLDRSRYIDQTQSFNCWMKDPVYPKINAFHFMTWKGGAKTGMYYLRQTARTDPLNFAIDTINIPERKSSSRFVCVGENGCVGCES